MRLAERLCRAFSGAVAYAFSPGLTHEPYKATTEKRAAAILGAMTNTPCFGMLMASLPYKGGATIGNDVWIGYDALIMPGVKIGNGAIVSSRSVVVKDAPAYAVVGGNPARVLKERFSAEDVEALESIAWWNWPIEKITQNLEHIVSADIDALKSC